MVFDFNTTSTKFKMIIMFPVSDSYPQEIIICNDMLVNRQMNLLNGTLYR